MAAAVPARFRSASASSGAGSDFVAHVRPRLEVSTRARQFFVPHDSVPRTQPLVVESNDTDVGLTRAELTFALAMSETLRLRGVLSNNEHAADRDDDGEKDNERDAEFHEVTITLEVMPISSERELQWDCHVALVRRPKDCLSVNEAR
jgi:hypothetical protein